jgi:hypothetical protein
MGARKMTFSVPEDLAREFLRIVPVRDRSKYVATALAERLRAEDEALAQACDIANASEDIRAIEQEFDAISVDLAEPWTDAAAR